MVEKNGDYELALPKSLWVVQEPDKFAQDVLAPGDFLGKAEIHVSFGEQGKYVIREVEDAEVVICERRDGDTPRCFTIENLGQLRGNFYQVFSRPARQATAPGIRS